MTEPDPSLVKTDADVNGSEAYSILAQLKIWINLDFISN